MFAFCIWLLMCSVFAWLGAMSWKSKKAVRFWTVSQQIQVSDVQKYNRAVSKMWFIFALFLAVLGIPALAGQNSVWIVFTILGGMMLAIALMVVYTMIEKKYRVY